MRVLAAILALSLCLPAHAVLGNSIAFPPETRIQSATQQIASGKLKGRALAQAYASRGLSYEELKRYREALADYDRAIAAQESIDMPVGYHRAILLQAMGRSGQMRKDMQAGLVTGSASWKNWAVRDAALARSIQGLCRNRAPFARAIQLTLEAGQAFETRDMKKANRLADDAWKIADATIQQGYGRHDVIDDWAMGYRHAVRVYEHKGQPARAAGEKLMILAGTLALHGDASCAGPPQPRPIITPVPGPDDEE